MIISIGGDIGQTADVVKTRMKEKKTEEQTEAEKRREEEEQLQDMEKETDPEIKAAKQLAIEARQEAEAAEKRAKEAESELKKMELLKKIQKGENLDANDQGAIQGATQSGIETIR
jgi:predicted transcriptional regulator